MQLIAPIIPLPVAGPSQLTSINNGANQGFQLAQSSALPSAPGFSATANPALGNQTLSALLQTQDIGHAHGHGGGHHGVKNMAQDAARQHMAASAEAQRMNRSKKLTNTAKFLETSDADQADQQETSADDANAQEEDKQPPNEKQDS